MEEKNTNPYLAPVNHTIKIFSWNKVLFYLLSVFFAGVVILGNYLFYFKLIDAMQDYQINAWRPYFRQGIILFVLSLLGLIFIIANYIYTFSNISIWKVLIATFVFCLSLGIYGTMFYQQIENTWLATLQYILNSLI